MNRALKFRHNLWGVATVVVAMLGVAFFLALRSARQSESVFEWSTHTEEVLDKISQARFGRSRLMNQLWSFRVSRRPDLPAHFHDDMDNLRKNLADLRRLTSDNPNSDLVPVSFETEITETGMLQLWCAARDGRRWKLEFNVRETV